MEETSAKCSICLKAANLKCTGCLKTFYCSRQHQKEDWVIHKKICCPYKVSNIGLPVQRLFMLLFRYHIPKTLADM